MSKLSPALLLHEAEHAVWLHAKASHVSFWCPSELRTGWVVCAVQHHFDGEDFIANIKVSYVALTRTTLCHVTFDLPESSSARTAGDGSSIRELLVVNCDLEPECVDSELRVALQWIAASELGLPALYFRKSKEKRVAKVPRTVWISKKKMLLIIWFWLLILLLVIFLPDLTVK